MCPTGRGAGAERGGRGEGDLSKPQALVRGSVHASRSPALLPPSPDTGPPARTLTSTGPRRRGCIAPDSAAAMSVRSASLARPLKVSRAQRERSCGSTTSTDKPPPGEG